jgi:hypothetical protein
VYSEVKHYILDRVSLTEREWEIIKTCFVPKRVAKRDFISREGQVCRYIAFINRGCLHYFYTREQGEITGHIFFEHSFLSDYYSFLTQEPGLQNIQAIEDSELLLMNYENVQMLYQTVPAW